MNSILIVGKDTQDIADLGWKHNTNYTVVEMTDKLTDNAIDTVTNSDMIILCDPAIYELYDEDEFCSLLEKLNCLLIFVQDEDTFDPSKYDNILKQYPETSLEYIRNEEDAQISWLEYYMTEQVLKGRKDGDSTLSTSESGS